MQLDSAMQEALLAVHTTSVDGSVVDLNDINPDNVQLSFPNNNRAQHVSAAKQEYISSLLKKWKGSLNSHFQESLVVKR